MLARSPEEIELFNKMDHQMGLNEGKGKRMIDIMAHREGINMDSNVNWRLIQEWEVPEWIKVKPVDPNEEKEDMLNLGKRNRKMITDPHLLNMTDKDFTNAVEKGEDLNEYQKKMVEKRKARVEKGGPEFSSSDEDDEISPSVPTFKPNENTKKKTGETD